MNINMTKTCSNTNCKQEKSITEFNKRKTTKDGLTFWCKSCILAASKKWKLNNLEKNKQSDIKYRENNKDIIAQKTKEWYLNNKERVKDNIQKWNQSNPNYMKDYQKDYFNKTKETRRKKRNLNQTQYRENNKHIVKWRILLENTLKRLGKNKENSTTLMLGYSALQLKEHLDKQGMDWFNHEIDHKIPVTWFSENTPPHIVNDLRNLQPVEPIYNKTKNNKWADKVDEEYYILSIEYLKEEFRNKLN
jgi:hypothetical protein